jgi:serine/threonine-protein kinase HipA
MKKLDAHFTRCPRDSIRVGTLAEERGRIYFEYDTQFLATGLNLSPIRLPREPGLQEHTNREFGPLPGLFDDSLPDGWGLLLMNRHFRRLGLNLAEVSPLDRLAWLGSRTMGALTYHPAAERNEGDTTPFDLHKLASASLEIFSGEAVDVLPQLLRAGGSPGGARPKVLVGWNPTTDEIRSGEDDLPEDFEHWLVKFTAGADNTDAGAIEQAYALMAREAGIDMPPTRLFETAEGERFFGIKRFDRYGNRRYHVHTFGNLVHSNFRIPSADYGDLLKVTSLLTRNHQEVLRAFRQMVFNVLAHNRDDHVKNFSFLLNDTNSEWTLSPAYDLTHTAGPGGEHTMTLAGEGRSPGRVHMLQLADRADIAERDATAIVDEVAAAISRWPHFAETTGVHPATVAEIAKTFPRF